MKALLPLLRRLRRRLPTHRPHRNSPAYGRIAFACLCCAETVTARDSDLLDGVVKAWTERQERARSFDVVAAGTEFRCETTFSAAELASRGVPSVDPLVLPETSFDIRLRLAANEGRYRLEYEGRSDAPKPDGYPAKRQLEVYDGAVHSSLFFTGQQPFPNAHIRKEPTPVPARFVHVKPVMIVLRPFDPQAGVFDARELRVVSQHAVIDNRPCVELSHGESTIWVDPARGFVPVRYHEMQRGVLIRSIEVEYHSDPRAGWLPASWKNTQLDPDGKVVVSMSCQVTEVRVGALLPADTFRAELPAGTWVRDYVRNATYIVRPDGTNRPVLPAEEHKTYQQLVSSEPVKDPVVSRRVSWLIWANIFFFMLFATAYLLYRRSRSSMRTNE